MTTDVYYQKNQNGTFSIIVDGEVFNTPITSEDAISILTDEIDGIIWMTDDDGTFVLKLSDEKNPIGIILDIYDNGINEEPTETYSFLFDDYLN